MSLRNYAVGLLALAGSICNAAPPVASTNCNGRPYSYDELAGYGFVLGTDRDKYGDSLSLGSAIAITSWGYIKQQNTYVGTLYGLPDRGWNTNGTLNFASRVHKFAITLKPAPDATVTNPSAPNLKLQYLDTILLKAPDGSYCTGLDPDQNGVLSFPGFPDLPGAFWTGDGYGGPGSGGKGVAIDAEGLVINSDGSFWVSDEYGPYVYKFDKDGTMTGAIAPPDAILPLRQGQVSFSADSPPIYDPNKHPVPANPTQGRQNNQGFEGLTASPDGKKLYVLLQSAARQEGGSNAATRIYTRLLQYAIDGNKAPKYEAEYVLPLPTFVNAAGQTRIAAQSELHFASDNQFFFLPRDSSVGRTFPATTSVYRHVDVFDITKATNIAGPAHDAFNASIASTAGVLNSDITAATVCPFLDVNVNAQLGRFGLHNGGIDDSSLLNEKWEGIAVVPSNFDCKKRDGDGSTEYFIFVASDNDFITQDGYTNFGKTRYKDATGFNLDNQILVFKVTLGNNPNPLVG